jgi:hypothetical protein
MLPLQDIRYFLFIIAIIIMGFGVAFSILFLGTDTYDYAHPATAFVTMFRMMLVRCCRKSLPASRTILQGDYDAHLIQTQAASPALAWALFLAFMISSAIILLNLLIALMGNSFDRVKKNDRAGEEVLYCKHGGNALHVVEWMLEQAKILLEFELAMPQDMLRDPRYFPVWLQVRRY